MSNLTFYSLRSANNARQKEWCGGKGEPELAFRALEFIGEAGELMNLFKKAWREAGGYKGSVIVPGQIKEELADCAITLDLLARALNIDLGKAIIAKFNADSQKHGFKTRLVEKKSV